MTCFISQRGSAWQSLNEGWPEANLFLGRRLSAAEKFKLNRIGKQLMMKKESQPSKWEPFRFASWDPMKELNELHNRINSLLRRANGGAREGAELAVGSDFGEWSPAVDISEDDKEFTIVADLPEAKKEDVKVSIDNGMMTISGERKHEHEEKKKKYHRVERSYGRYSRSFTLPEGVDEDKVEAKFEDGVLTVHLPKNEKAEERGRTIAVK